MNGTAGGQGRPGGLRPLDVYSGSLAHRTYLSLREAIISLGFRPGEVLRKSDICMALGVSRSPVAEAIARLATEGLVHVVPQAGTYVALFSMREIREGAFLRQAIELAAIEAVAPAITPDQITRLKRNLRGQEGTLLDGDHAGFYQLDAEMHDLILSYTGYARLAQVAATAWVHVDRARQIVLPIPGRVAETLDEHRDIVAALEAHDTDRARDAMRRHLGRLVTFLEPLERERPDLFEPP